MLCYLCLFDDSFIYLFLFYGTGWWMARGIEGFGLGVECLVSRVSCVLAEG